MRDFVDDLERQLSVLAERHPDLEPERQAARRSRRRRPAALGGLTAVIAAIVAAFTMTGTSLAELPILGTPTRDASSLKAKAQAAARAGVNFEQAHVFGTPAGPGYALVNEQTQTLCVVVPDPRAPGEYGSSCGAPISKIEREGLLAELPGDLGQDPDATSLAVFVLPEGADDVRLVRPPARARLDVESGVAVIDTPAEVTLAWTVDGRSSQRVFEGPFQKSTSMGIICPDGRQVEAPAPAGNLSPQAASKQINAARKKACG